MMPYIRRIPVPGEIIDQKHKSACLAETCRVLDVHDGPCNRIVVIPVTPRKSKGRLYFVGPCIMELSKVLNDIDQHWLTILLQGVTPRADASAKDEDLDKKYLRRGQEMSNPRLDRAARYAIIQPLVADPENRKLLFDPQVRSERIAARALELDDGKRTIARTKKMIAELLNQFWAGGSEPGALTPFSGAKGGRGKPRIQKRKHGRRNTPTATGQTGREGLVMSEEDKDICGFAWRNYYIRGNTIAKAMRRMWREFYSIVETDNRGMLHKHLLPDHQRPTRSQFERWGVERSPGHDSWKKQLTKFNLGRIDRALFGSSSDDVVAVGQRGSADSTSPDIDFVSVANRLDRIGPAHRILVVDSLYGYISGFYLGLNAPSAETVKLAFLHSLTDKAEWLKWLGLNDQDPTDWIPIRYANVLADNTDLRCEGVVEALDRIGTGVKYVGIARSDLNSPAETSHHILHRMADHNLYGTSHGQRHERGEEHADILARHTILEAIRETARAIYTHNTMELDIRPTLEMRRDLIDKGIRLTRANLTRWKSNQGKVAMSLIGHDEARIKLLPQTRGVFTQHGVKLLRPDTGQKREFVEPIRYISRHPVILERIMKAKVGRRGLPAESFDDDFLHDPYKPTEIFYRNPIDGELIRLELKTKDEDLPFECSHADIIGLMKSDAVNLFESRISREEALSDMEAGQESTKQEASDAYDDTMEKLDKPPSKSALRRGKKENREREKNTYQYGMPILTSPCVEETDMLAEPADLPHDKPASSDFPPATNQDAPPAHDYSTSSGTDEPSASDDPSQPKSMILQSILRRRQEGTSNAH